MFHHYQNIHYIFDINLFFITQIFFMFRMSRWITSFMLKLVLNHTNTCTIYFLDLKNEKVTFKVYIELHAIIQITNYCRYVGNFHSHVQKPSVQNDIRVKEGTLFESSLSKHSIHLPHKPFLITQIFFRFRMSRWITSFMF